MEMGSYFGICEAAAGRRPRWSRVSSDARGPVQATDGVDRNFSSVPVDGGGSSRRGVVVRGPEPWPRYDRSPTLVLTVSTIGH